MPNVLLEWLNKLSGVLIAAALIWFATQVIASRDKDIEQDGKLQALSEWTKSQAVINQQVIDLAKEMAVLKAIDKERQSRH